jgi:hypothetical protein
VQEKKKYNLVAEGQVFIMKSRTVQLLLHILCSGAFLMIPLLNPSHHTEWFSPEHLHDIIGFALTLGFFYLNFYYLLPGFYFQKKYIQYALCAIFCFLLTSIIPHVLIRADIHEEGLFQIEHLMHNAPKFLIVFFISLVLKINSMLRKVQSQKLNSEISFLKAQINPHFLFNTLNSIYSLAIIKSDEAPEAVVKLSDIMRYSINETDKDYVALEKEIGYITNYIELQKMRLTDNVKLYYDIQGHCNGQTIAPFLLIPFVENAFKYGTSPEEPSTLSVRIVIANKTIEMQVCNSKVPSGNNAYTETGPSIETTRQRLKLLYAGRHQLHIDENDKYYNVSLKINLP